MSDKGVLRSSRGGTIGAAIPRRSFGDRVSHGNLGGYLLLTPAVLVLAGLTIYPLIYSIYISLTDYQLGSPNAAKFIGLDNFTSIPSDAIFTGALWTTLKLVVVGVPLQLLLGYICARILQASHNMIGSRILRTFFILPVMLSSLAVGLFWSFILDPLIGVANWILGLVHVAPQAWFSDANMALPTILLVYLWQWVPFTSMLLLAGLLNISPQIYEAAQIDGAHWYNRVLSIDLPLLRRVAAIAGILATVEIIRLFDLIYGTTRGGPGTATLTNAVAIFRFGFENFQTGYAAACSLVILVFTILIAQVFVRLLREEEEGYARR